MRSSSVVIEARGCCQCILLVVVGGSANGRDRVIDGSATVCRVWRARRLGRIGHKLGPVRSGR